MGTYFILLLFIVVLWLMFSRRKSKRHDFTDNGSTGSPDASGSGDSPSQCDSGNCDGGGDGGGD